MTNESYDTDKAGKKVKKVLEEIDRQRTKKHIGDIDDTEDTDRQTENRLEKR